MASVGARAVALATHQAEELGCEDVGAERGDEGAEGRVRGGAIGERGDGCARGGDDVAAEVRELVREETRALVAELDENGAVQRGRGGGRTSADASADASGAAASGVASRESSSAASSAVAADEAGCASGSGAGGGSSAAVSARMPSTRARQSSCSGGMGAREGGAEEVSGCRPRAELPRSVSNTLGDGRGRAPSRVLSASSPAGDRTSTSP